MTNSFLEAWKTEMPKLLSRELPAPVLLTPATALPEAPLWLALDIHGARVSGSLTVLTAASGKGDCAGQDAGRGLHALLTEAKLVPAGETDTSGDEEIWSGLLVDAATSAARVAGLGEVTVTARPAAVRGGLPLAAFELRMGPVAVAMAFADEVARTPETQAVAADGHAAGTAPRSLDLLLDVELEASLRFGSREMPLGELMELGPGDVIELERLVSEPVDLIVGDKIVARGDVVLVNGSFGLRVGEVAEPKLCLESIRCLF